MSDGVVHAIGMDVQFGYLRRQRCAWCGQLLVDEDLSRMSWPLNEDGSDPGTPGMWPAGDLVEVVGELGAGRMIRVVPEDEWPFSQEPGAPEGARTPPPNCCLHLDPEVTR